MREAALKFVHLHDLIDVVTAPRATVRGVRDVDARRGTDYFTALQGCGWPDYVRRFGLEDFLGDMFFEYELETSGPDDFDTSKYEGRGEQPFTPTRDPLLRARFGLDRIERSWFRKPAPTVDEALNRAGIGGFPGRRLTAEAQHHLRWALFAAERRDGDALLAHCLGHLLRAEMKFRFVEAPLHAELCGVRLPDLPGETVLTPDATEAIERIVGVSCPVHRLSAWLDWSYGPSHRWFTTEAERLLAETADILGPDGNVPPERARVLADLLLPARPAFGLLDLSVAA